MSAEPDDRVPPVDAGLVSAALRAAGAAGKDVAQVPLVAIAREAGISRSTLIRRLGGTRAPLEEAVRAAGADPGRRRPVAERAVEAAGQLISEQGLAAVTLEAVAIRAGCSVYSLYAAFGGRDELMRGVFERYSPVLGIEELLAGPGDDLDGTVRAFYRVLVRALTREPAVMPAMIAEMLARPGDPAQRTLAQHVASRALAGPGQWLATAMKAGRIREMPLPLLMNQLVGPIVAHLLSRPALNGIPGFDLPPVEQVCDVLADAFLRAVALPPPQLDRPDQDESQPPR